ncbi:tRNA modification GTPase [Drechslerella dactyloides]|uniref:tRNA modification GTPase n=1 Tax=Drechslerella dactyloides TaxID=74499 RepID=A0AAD6J5B0_DREDA|nr:tRNA modification GTPase [Drechslerella dactyloides]
MPQSKASGLRDNWRPEIRIQDTLILRFRQIYHALCPSKPPPKPRVATLRTLFHPSSDVILDPAALVLLFPAPHSFTGEDILELHIHGGPAVLKSVLAALPKCAALLSPRTRDEPATSSSESSDDNALSRRILPAETGEFTRRAFYNSRLSLPQIEALGDLLAAETAHQLSQSARTTSTGADTLATLYRSWHEQLTCARGELEALIDFSEDQQFEESPTHLLRNVTQQLVVLSRELRGYLEQAVKGELLRNGINLALIGAPNVGKSSLLNAVVGREAAIVSSRAGTTRDVVDVAVDVEGWMVVIGDTAGFRPTNEGDGSSGGKWEEVDEIEVEGMKRARRRVAAADVVVFLTSVEENEGAVRLRLEDAAVSVAKQALDDGKELVVVVNKVDKLADGEVPAEIATHIGQRIPGLLEGRILGISCRDDRYKGTLQNLLHTLAGIFSKMTETESAGAWAEAIGASSRQRVLVEECRRHVDEFLVGLDGQDASVDDDVEDVDVVLKAETLRRAAGCMAKIMGRGDASTVDEVLGVVFERHLHRDARPRVVLGQLKVLKLEPVDILHAPQNLHLGKLPRCSRQLPLQRLHVVLVHMCIAHDVRERAGLHTSDVGNHLCQKRVAGNVERHAETHVARTLVELARDLTLVRDACGGGRREGHVELREHVAGRKRHLLEVCDVPRAEDDASVVRIVLELVDHFGELVDALAGVVGVSALVFGAEVAPLEAVDGAEVAFRPFGEADGVEIRSGAVAVPDLDAGGLERGGGGVSGDEPEEFVDDGAEVDALGGEEGEGIIREGELERERGEDGDRAGAGPV